MFKLGQKVKDIKREITGTVCKILKNEIHVEYLRFKGDTEPFYIS